MASTLNYFVTDIIPQKDGVVRTLHLYPKAGGTGISTVLPQRCETQQGEQTSSGFRCYSSRRVVEGSTKGAV